LVQDLGDRTDWTHACFILYVERSTDLDSTEAKRTPGSKAI
jgi:hypothetical protein